MIVSHRATAVLEASRRHLNDRDASQAWTLNAIQRVILSGQSAGSTRAEVQALIDGNARRLAELDTRYRREHDAISAKTYPDETDE